MAAPMTIAAMRVCRYIAVSPDRWFPLIQLLRDFLDVLAVHECDVRDRVTALERRHDAHGAIAAVRSDGVAEGLAQRDLGHRHRHALLLRILQVVAFGDRLALLHGAGLVIDDDLGELVGAGLGVDRELQRAVIQLVFGGDGTPDAFAGLETLLERNTCLRQRPRERGRIALLIRGPGRNAAESDDGGDSERDDRALPHGIPPSIGLNMLMTSTACVEAAPDVRPVDRVHERVHIGRRLSAVVHVIGMLVHIEREDRLAAGERVGVIRRPLVHEFAVAPRPGEQHPAGAAAQRLAHRGKLRAPALQRAEVAGQRVAQGRIGLALRAERGEEELVQDHRHRRDQLLVLEAVHGEDGRAGEVEGGELLGDRVQALDGAAVIVLVMADDELLRHALDPLRIAGERLHRVGHEVTAAKYRAMPAAEQPSNVGIMPTLKRNSARSAATARTSAAMFSVAGTGTCSTMPNTWRSPTWPNSVWSANQMARL